MNEPSFLIDMYTRLIVLVPFIYLLTKLLYKSIESMADKIDKI